MSNFEKIQSDELAECQDYQDWIEYQQSETIQAIDADLEYQIDSEWDEHWDEFDAELEDINIELEQAAHLERFDEIFDVIHPSIQGSR